ncbi:MAG: DUF1501 domain-containing protein [Planctomycetota bacterium]|nr:DUF1501 domain-containing protein [Planctomycetota bacterium]
MKYPRRDFLRSLSTLAAASGMLTWRERLALAAAGNRKRRACILLWMAGGPSPYETFSPLEGHKNGGETKAISTSVPGIRIAEHFPHMAAQMHDVALIRSLTSKEGNHNRASFLLHTGYLPTPTVKYPALGAVVAAQRSQTKAALPAFVRIGSGGRLRVGGGLLGSEFDPFVHRNPENPPNNTQPSTGQARYQRRLELLRELQEDQEIVNDTKQIHQTVYGQASRMILSSEMKAFDLAEEKEPVRNAYGDSDFASGCLLARRLIEAGVTFVEVNCRGWDTHQDNFSKTRDLAGEVDRPTAALIEDLKQRGLLDSTLVVWMGEFGRTPKINARGGRDHYPKVFTAALAGGGIQGGQAVGRMSQDGTAVAERPVTVPDLFQTYCHSLRLDAESESMSSLGRPIKVVEEGSVVEELF